MLYETIRKNVTQSGKHGRIPKLAWLPAIVLIALASCWTSVAAQDADQSPIRVPEAQRAAYARALKPIATMPVQHAGMVRSVRVFAEDHLLAIYGKRTYHGTPALQTILNLLAQPEAAKREPLFKVERPKLAEILGGKYTSLETYNDPNVRDQLAHLLHTEQEAYSRPIQRIHRKVQRLEELNESFAIIPRENEWLAPAELSKEELADLPEQDQRIVSTWQELKQALRDRDTEAMGKAAEQLTEEVRKAALEKDADLSDLKIGALYYEHHPFGKSAVFYLFAALFYLSALVFKPGPNAGAMRRYAFPVLGYIMLLLGFAEQVFGLAARWMLANRAPLSNLYESFTFAVAGMVLVALIFEVTHRLRIAGFGAGLLGFIFMVLAHKAPIFESEIRPLMPALQSSWLTYHVVTIMLSYSAFAISFFVSLCYLFKDYLGHVKPLKPIMRILPSLESLDTFNYKIIAVGFPLLTAGIILGAVWANTAWGRPWGWDPKETWSAVTWLIYAGYLHVRLIGGWKGRRAAIMAIIGFACVLFTYFGVNYLLPGLHSYV